MHPFLLAALLACGSDPEPAAPETTPPEPAPAGTTPDPTTSPSTTPPGGPTADTGFQATYFSVETSDTGLPAQPTGPCVEAAETGDDPSSSLSVPFPTTICGDIDRVSELEADADLDWFTFVAPANGTWRLALYMPVDARYDLFVEQNGLPYTEGVDASPASAIFHVVAGRTYRVHVQGVSGPTGDYSLLAESIEIDTGLVADITSYGVQTISGAQLQTSIGTETLVFADVGTGVSLCEWTFVTEDWATANMAGPSPIQGHPCQDFDGNRCAFAHANRTYRGSETGGYQCDTLFGINTNSFSDLGTRPMGYHDDFRVNGQSYGPLVTYLFDLNVLYPSLPVGVYYYWLGLLGETPTYSNGVFEWELSLGQLPYTP